MHKYPFTKATHKPSQEKEEFWSLDVAINKDIWKFLSYEKRKEINHAIAELTDLIYVTTDQASNTLNANASQAKTSKEKAGTNSKKAPKKSASPQGSDK